MTANLVKMKGTFKKLVELPPVYTLVKSYSQCQSPEDVFRFYSEEEAPRPKYAALAPEDYGRFINSRSLKRQPSLTRTITSLSYKVGKQMISLAEGMPNEEVFPFNSFEMGMKAGGSITMHGSELSSALQYLPSQGMPLLLTALRKFQAELHRPPPLPSPRDVIVTNGSQHGIYQCCELFTEPGDPVLVSEYCYTGVFAALKPYDPEILRIPEDADGVIPESLENILADRLSRGQRMPKYFYTIPTGNNPTGVVISEERRRQIYDLACKYDFLILEDDPYMYLNYKQLTIPSFLSLDTCGRVVRMDSFSKVVSAGLRAAWITAPKPLVERLELHAQAEVLHSCTLSQAILLKLLNNKALLGEHMLSARTFYKKRRDALHSALQDAQIADLAEWLEPDAGLFLWLRVRGVDDVYNMVFQTAFERGLMLIPGQAFMNESSGRSHHVRLTFSKVPMELMPKAARQLALIIRDEQASTLQTSQRAATER